MLKETCAAFIAIAMLFSIPFFLEGGDPLTVTAPTRGSLTLHDPIVIEGDANFTSANGVRSGAGTKADPYIISGWDIDPTDLVPCISIANTTSFFTVSDCRLHHSTLSKENPTQDEYDHMKGLVLFKVENARIESNSFHENGAYDIYMESSNKNIVQGNKMNSQVINEHLLMDYSSYNMIDDNEIDPLIPYKSVSPLRTVPFAGRGIKLQYECMHNQISNNTIRNHWASGIEIIGNFNIRNRIVYNLITDNGGGIQDGGQRGYVGDNIVMKNTFTGIDVGGDHVTYERNLVADNGENGFFVTWGTQFIEGNIIRGNGKNGIYLRTSSSHINNNLVLENEENGIHVQGQENIIDSNIISDNHIYGIMIVNYTDANRYDDEGLNRIRYNNFIDNGNGSVSQTMDDDKNPGTDWSVNPPKWGAQPNSWKRNYWSDHTGPDEDSDDIVDIPYIISGQARVNDSEPVVVPYTINVTGPIFPLMIITSDQISVKAGNEYSVEYKATENPSGSTLIWSMRTNASWLSFSEDNILHGEPDLADIGVYWVNISVTDGYDCDRHVFNIYVYEIDDPTIGPTKNETEPKKNGTEPKNETENQPPQGGQILLPPGEMYEGDELVFSTFVYDPDLEENETLNYTWYIVGIGIVGYGPQIELNLQKDNYTIIVNVTDPKGASLEIQKTISVLEKGKTLDPPDPNPDENVWWESPWVVTALVLATNLLIIAFFGFVMVYRERQLHDISLTLGSYDSGSDLRSPPRGNIPIEPLHSADGILSGIVSDGGISDDGETMARISTGARRMYDEGKISRRTYGIIRRNLHGSEKEE